MEIAHALVFYGVGVDAENLGVDAVDGNSRVLYCDVSERGLMPRRASGLGPSRQA